MKKGTVFGILMFLIISGANANSLFYIQSQMAMFQNMLYGSPTVFDQGMKWISENFCSQFHLFCNWYFTGWLADGTFFDLLTHVCTTPDSVTKNQFGPEGAPCIAFERLLELPHDYCIQAEHTCAVLMGSGFYCSCAQQ